MPIKFTAIRPKKPVIVTKQVEARLAHELNTFVAAVEDRMATYPTQAPTKSGYRRTMTLSRSWSIVPARRVGSSLVAQVGSNSKIAPYNIFVEGEQQTAEMRRRNWPRIMEVCKELWPKSMARIRAVLASAGD